MPLEIENLDVRYGRVHAVRGANLSVAEGEIVAVLGANGAGKSSLLKAVLGLVPAAAGCIRVGGADVTAWPAARRLAQGIALVPEGRRILVGLTVEENLLMGGYARRDAAALRAEIQDLYDRFPNLGARRYLPAAVLSGGEQQMLAIGRGLLARPRLMMLDEPSLGLSPLLVRELFVLLRKLNADGLALLLVEQNTTMALAVAARAYVMELGRIIMHGRPSELAADSRLRAAYLGGKRPPRGAAEARHP
ncbi:MAG TPA: ABC transporter ATP-binding protein [Burkholderiales bacterium]|nr:ABC transporter ATP-binding protein [Burkholderiales bacterium]